MSVDSMQQYYARRAPEYDDVYQKPERQKDLRDIERRLPLALAGRAILEIACGTGYWTQFIAPSARSIVALDASAETLALARMRIPSDKVQFVQGDAHRLPLAAGGFDAAFAGFWISHVANADVPGFLRNFHRALRPGAKVLLLDNRFVAGSSTAISGRDGDGNSYQDRVLQDGSVHRVLKNFPSEPELRQILAGAAEEIQFHEWEYFWAIEYALAAS